MIVKKNYSDDSEFSKKKTFYLGNKEVLAIISSSFFQNSHQRIQPLIVTSVFNYFFL